MSTKLLENNSRPILFHFEHGQLKEEAKVTTSFKYMKSMTPNSNERIVTAQTGKLDYSGKILQKQQSFVKYYIGLVDKRSKKIEHVEQCLHCTLRPKIDVEKKKEDDEKQITYRDKMDNLVEAFGTAKQKRLLTQRKKNEAVHGTMSDKVQKIAEDVLEKKPAVTPKPAQTPNAIEEEILPSRNADATDVKQYYNIDDIISYRTYQKVHSHAKEVFNYNSQDLLNWRKENKYSEFILDMIEKLPVNLQEREKKATYLFYLNYMIKFSNMSFRAISRKEFPEDIPEEVHDILLDQFTRQSEAIGGRIQRYLPKKCKDQLICWILILALVLSDYELKCTLLLKEIKYAQTRLVKMLRFIGCSVNSNKNRKRKADGDEPEAPHVIEYIATLRLPKKENQDNADTPKTKKTKTEKTPKTPKTPKTGAKKTAMEGTPQSKKVTNKETNGATPPPIIPTKKIKTEHSNDTDASFL